MDSVAALTLEIRFPEGASYGTRLGQLRKALKPYLRDLEIRKRCNGVVIGGHLEKAASVPLILPERFDVIG
jgi:hypothetical protein